MDEILIVYTTLTGATRTVAEAIGEGMQCAKVQVDVRRAREVRKLSSYRAVVVGTSVHMGLLPGEVKRFLRRHRKALFGRPVAYFIVCLATTKDTDENRKAVKKYIRKMRSIAPEIELIADVALFGGAVLAGMPEFNGYFPFLKCPSWPWPNSPITAIGR